MCCHRGFGQPETTGHPAVSCGGVVACTRERGTQRHTRIKKNHTHTHLDRFPTFIKTNSGWLRPWGGRYFCVFVSAVWFIVQQNPEHRRAHAKRIAVKSQPGKNRQKTACLNTAVCVCCSLACFCEHCVR